MIKVFKPNLSFFDKISVFKALLKNEISGTSSEVKKFEEQICTTFERKYAVTLSNGSSALEVAFRLLKLKKGDEVILPSFTIISCLSAVIRSGGTPVFCDVDPNTWNMTFEDIKKSFTKKTKAVLIVHSYGLTADAVNIREFCIQNDIKIIEDTAEAHGQKIGNKKCGTFGDISTLSFYANKHVTTGEGGAILTDNIDFYNSAKKIINLDFDNRKRFVHDNLYWNYRLGGLQSALGTSQLKKLNKVINSKIIQGNKYIDLFKKYNVDVQLPLVSTTNSKNHFWVFGIVLNNGLNRDLLMERLFDKGIETRPFFHPLHLQPALKEKEASSLHLPVSEKIGKYGLYIPLGKHVTYKKQKKIVLEIKNLISEIG
ncbi:DegT/DnrJ/EryC1/StrS family aminotransferase [Acidimicrobiaceae bacterium]|nr:DegT/DnrJ/EryC1/StrS family aminotransferase [Acidimicrobiaceae bacterium]